MKRIQRILLGALALVATALQADVSVSLSGEDSAGNRAVVLKNSLIQAVFSSRGGRLTSLADLAAGRELVWDNGKPESGALKDQFPPQFFEFRDGQYAVEVVKNSSELGIVKFTSLGIQGQWKFIRISRTFSLAAGESVIRCKVEIFNQRESMAPATLTYWQHNFFGVKGEDNTFFAPTGNGVRAFVPSDATNKELIRDLSRGWLAMLGKSGSGVVVLPEYRRLAYAYAWYCKGSGGLPVDTLEWRLVSTKIAEDTAMLSSFSLGVVEGLRRIDGAGEAGAGEATVGKVEPGKPIPVALRLDGFTTQPVTVRLMLGGKCVAEGQSTLDARAVTTLSLSVPPQQPGAYAMTAELLGRDGKRLFDLLIPLQVGEGKAKIVFDPLEKRQSPDEGEEAWEMPFSDAFVTPHCKWAANAPALNALFLLPSSGVRDVIELKQRIALNAAVPTLWPAEYSMAWRFASNPAPGRNGTETLGKYLDARRYDLFVVGSDILWPPWKPTPVSWSSIAEADRERILAAVKEGAGLVLVNPSGADAALTAILQSLHPYTALEKSMDFSAAPSFPKTKILAGAYGKGRVFVLQYPGKAFLAPSAMGSKHFPMFEFEHRYQEYQFAILARLLKLAAGAEPVITGCEAVDGSLRITAAKPCKLAIDYFNRYTEPIGNAVLDAKAGLNTVALPPGMSKDNYAHVRVADGSDFAYAVWNAKPEKRIRGIVLAKSFKAGEPVSGRVKLSGELAPDEALQVAIRDNLGREVWRGNAQNFQWDQRNAATNRHSVEAELRKDGKAVDRARAYFFLPEFYNVTENFANLLWLGGDTYPDYTFPYRFGQLVKSGFNFLYSGGPGGAYAEMLGTANTEVGSNWFGPYAFHDGGGIADWQRTHDKKYLKRPKCPSDPAFIAKIPETGVRAQAYRDFGTRHLFQLGDEMSITYYNSVWDVCFCDNCLAAFRKQLQARYGTLDALNKAWKTAFKSWDAVMPMTRVEILSHPSPAPWVEHRLFMDDLFAQTLERYRNELRRAYPEAKVGPTGVNSPPHVYGGNWNFRRMSVFDCASMYGTARIPLSFNRDKRMVMAYRGYVSPEAEYNNSFWEGIFCGERGSNNWYGQLFINPDLTPSKVRASYGKLLWELRSGPGDLLYHTPKAVGQVAILHSQNSLISNFLKDRKTDYYLKELSFARALEDLGLEYRFIAPDELTSGVLSKFKALILPESSAMSDAEVLAVRDFVANGGLCIADYQAATEDEVCNRREEPALDTLFGVAARRFRLKNIDSHTLPDGQIVQAGERVTLTTGKALYQAKAGDKEIPIAVENKFGKGRTLLLNFAPEYQASRNFRQDGGFRTLLDRFLKLPATARAVAASPVMHNFYRNGDKLYITLLPAPPPGDWKAMSLAEIAAKAFPAKLSLERPAHLYDVRQGKYLGFGKEFDLTLIPADGTMLAALPQRATAPILTAEPAVKAGEVAKVKIESADGGHHLYVVTVKAPDGTARPEYRRVLNRADGGGTFELPFALNDAKGKWTVTVKDAASGEEAQLLMTHQ